MSTPTDHLRAGVERAKAAQEAAKRAGQQAQDDKAAAEKEAIVEPGMRGAG